MRNRTYGPSEGAARIRELVIAARQLEHAELEKMMGPIVLFECGSCGCITRGSSPAIAVMSQTGSALQKIMRRSSALIPSK